MAIFQAGSAGGSAARSFHAASRTSTSCQCQCSTRERRPRRREATSTSCHSAHGKGGHGDTQSQTCQCSTRSSHSASGTSKGGGGVGNTHDAADVGRRGNAVDTAAIAAHSSAIAGNNTPEEAPAATTAATDASATAHDTRVGKISVADPEIRASCFFARGRVVRDGVGFGHLC